MTALTLDQVKTRALAIAREHLGEKRVERVEVEEGIDHTEQPSLNIMFVLKPAKNLKLPGDKLGQIGLDILDFLVSESDTRFPYTRYVRSDELKMLHAAQ